MRALAEIAWKSLEQGTGVVPFAEADECNGQLAGLGSADLDTGALDDHRERL